jgi:hypothetical protein
MGKPKPDTELTRLEVIRGKLSRRAHALEVEWATLHRDELRADWDRARQATPLLPIEPLD